MPEITNFQVADPIRYADDGDPYHVMTVFPPEGDGPFPALIVIHGGGCARGTRFKNDVVPSAEMYARRGIASFSIDYRLSTPDAPSWPANIQDVVCAMRHLKENATRYRIDPERVAVLGHSAGGHLAALVGTLQGDEPFLEGACGNPDISSRVVLVVAYAGPGDGDLMGMLKSSPSIAQFLGVTYSDAPELWRRAFPSFYISPDDPVFVIVQGTEDQTVPFQGSVSFADQLEAAGVETHLVLIEGAGHNIQSVETQNLKVRHVLDPLMRQILRL